MDRRSQQIRDDIDRRGKELREQVQKAQQESARLNQERMQAHKQYMDDLNRRISESRSSPPPPLRSGLTENTQRQVPRNIVPQNIIVAAPEPATSAPILPPASRAKVSEVQVGMDRTAVEGALGKPHSALSIPEEDGLVEVLTYMLDDRATAHVRIEKGKVASVKISN